METAEYMELEPIFEKIEKGARYWRNFQKKYRICSKDIVIVMSSDRLEFHNLTLRFLYALKEEKRVDAIYILHRRNLSVEYIKREATAFVHIVECTDFEMENLCLLSYLYKFSEQVVFNDYTNICDCDGKLLMDRGFCTAKDIVAVSILGLSEVPQDFNTGKKYEKVLETEQCENANFKFRRINWEEAEKEIKTGKSYGITNAGMEQMIREKTKLLVEEGKIGCGDEIVLFGMNRSSALVQATLGSYHVTAVVDNDKRKTGRKMNGVPVYEPSEYLKEYDEKKKIIIASKYYHSMCEQLYQFGYEVGREIFVVYYREYFYDVLPETITHYKEQIKAGEELYWRMRKSGAQGTMFLCPYPGTGDIYLTGLYLKQYRNENGIDKYALGVCSNVCKKVAELFGINAFLMLEKEIQSIISYARAVGMRKLSVQVLNDSFGEQNSITKLRGFKGIDFRTMFTNCVMPLKGKIVPASCTQKNADALFSRYHLPKGKTVLLSPYANTVNSLPDDFWAGMAEILQSKGYHVCTNVAVEDEKPVRGTEGIFIPYEMVIDFVDKAGCFVGLRSGLCDILSTTKAQIIILYPKKMPFGTGTLYDYFSLRKMDMREKKLIELEYDLEKMDEILEKVTEKIMNGEIEVADKV